MPKAAVDENADVFLAECEVRLAWQGKVPPPSAQSGGSKYLNQAQLG
jgi:hypothetical protein